MVDADPGEATDVGSVVRADCLTVGLWLGSPEQRASMAGTLVSQPLMPRWRLLVVDGELTASAVDVAVVDPHEVGMHVPCDRTGGLVIVLREPGEMCMWQGVGSLMLADDPRGHVARAVEETALGRVWISERLAPHIASVLSGCGERNAPEPRAALTPAERETLTLLLQGLPDRVIASRRWCKPEHSEVLRAYVAGQVRL
jgi:hypothetical protein